MAHVSFPFLLFLGEIQFTLQICGKELHDEAGLLFDVIVNLFVLRHPQMLPNELDHHLVVQVDHNLGTGLGVHARNLAGQRVLKKQAARN